MYALSSQESYQFMEQSLVMLGAVGSVITNFKVKLPTVLCLIPLHDKPHSATLEGKMFPHLTFTAHSF